MPPTTAFTGPYRGLVLSFDIGTTFSGAAYAILDPGQIPKILPITRYPGQENGDFKIPSVLYYSPDGILRAAGAEAMNPELKLEAEDEGLIFVEWFKLHLRPDYMQGIDSEELPPLPRRKTAVQVFSDFLGYLYTCARRYIQESHASGDLLWDSVKDRIDFILTHPNGWEGLQQSKMRQAAVRAQLVPDSAAGRSRIHFVTEGEASLHFCLDSGLATEVREGEGVMVIDAGGGTVDLSTYSIIACSPLRVEEVSAPGCILQGSTRINARARNFLEEKLKNSRYRDDITTMLERFDKATKTTFKDSNEKAYIHFGSLRDRDIEVGIRSGQLILEGSTVAQFFQPSVDAIIEAVKQQLVNPSVSRAVKTAFFVGGFAASPWLYKNLLSSLRETNVRLCRPDNHTNKAVAEGAISFYIEHFVTARIARVTYGSDHVVEFNPTDPEHVIRRARAHTKPSGQIVIPEAFSVLLSKVYTHGTRIRESEEVSVDFYNEGANERALNNVVADIVCYRGRELDPKFMDKESELFSPLCTVTGDTSKVPKVRRNGRNGVYYTQAFKVVLICGLTELKAQLSWMQKGVEKRGPAQVVYDIEATG
ncbi:hypothetical protein NLI96_g2044 [Meripilus lineatus]|uniref:Uncharacterized protein n=1 Tax=Meripilus lineatus TaxID=2056292 RepID=A0AAD5YGX4_9APHY|nr:hypothetical protein NLI96_g2044 [Physisporinus lineatus]